MGPLFVLAAQVVLPALQWFKAADTGTTHELVTLPAGTVYAIGQGACKGGSIVVGKAPETLILARVYSPCSASAPGALKTLYVLQGAAAQTIAVDGKTVTVPKAGN